MAGFPEMTNPTMDSVLKVLWAESNCRPNIPDAVRREYGGFIIKDGRNGRTGSRAEDPFTLIGAAWLTENAAIAFPVAHAADRPPRGHLCYTTMLYQFAEPFGVARVTRAI